MDTYGKSQLFSIFYSRFQGIQAQCPYNIGTGPDFNSCNFSWIPVHQFFHLLQIQYGLIHRFIDALSWLPNWGKVQERSNPDFLASRITLVKSRIIGIAGSPHIHRRSDSRCQQLIRIQSKSAAMLKQMGVEINESGKQISALSMDDFTSPRLDSLF